jgi:glucosamine--fructose-6-phosphate aminotransferase (isomerizing)
MCGIFGYSGKSPANNLVYQGLKRLEYRGYDSWGIVVNNGNNLKVFKTTGEIKEEKGFKALPITTTALAHTRWATHGGVTIKNAHPHMSSDSSFALVQNGIVANFSQLKTALKKKGYHFNTQTDTEVIVRLIEEEYKHSKVFEESVKKAFKKLQGRNTIAILRTNGDILAVRNGSPLVIGKGEDGIYLASDSLSFAPYTNKVIFLDDYDFVKIQKDKIYIENLISHKQKDIKVQELNNTYAEINKGQYDHYMIKEIVEQSQTILNAIEYSHVTLKPLTEYIKKAHRVYMVGAGTAGFAAGQIAYYLRNTANIDAQDIRSYEFKSYLNILSSKDLVLAVSQSGETADTIEVLEIAKKKGCKIASIVNMQGTTISRMSDFKYYTNSGPEICVASTKVFTAQCSWGYILAKDIVNKLEEGKKNITQLGDLLTKYFNEKTYKDIEKIAKILKEKEHLFVLGKGENAYTALEGALKIKEISYKHIEGFMAGELKHGVIALVEKGTPVFGIISKDEDSNDIVSSMEQVKARGALTIGVGDKRFSKLNIFDYFLDVPQINEISNISNVIPFQLMSYFLSKELGNNIDKPRNLAKSVTVK